MPATCLMIIGCATLTEDQCTRGNWYEIGIQDGANGYAQRERFQKHQTACREYGVTIKPALYEKGYQEGIKQYCVPSNGFRLGKSGTFYGNVCPPGLEAAFLRQYQIGAEVFQLETQLSSTYRIISDVEDRLDAEKDDSRKRSLRDDLTRLTREKDELQRRLIVMELKGTGTPYPNGH